MQPSSIMSTHTRLITRLLLVIAVPAIFTGVVSTATPHFYPDDPIAREPESQDASKTQPYFRGSLFEMATNLFITADYKPSGLRAQNINTIDEVPDSNWFTNRIGSTSVRIDDLVRGPNVGTPPDPSHWTLTREKTAGAHPGFTARDAKGETWFLEFDPTYFPEGATGAVAVATKIFWALGYNQVESFLTTFDPARVDFDPNATLRRPSGARTRFTKDDMNSILERVARRPDGTYRVIAGRQLSGRILGGFQYDGTRPDDPNDVVPHEHRRELRALARLRRMDQSHRSQGVEYARHARHRERSHGRQTLSAGCRVDIRHVQRPVRVGSELRALLPDGHDAAPTVFIRVCAEPVADHPVRGVPVDRQVRRRSVRSEGMAPADADDGVSGAPRR
jgi:hypothetical protein